MRFPVVLFDLDGTLVDSGAIILGSFHHATETVLQRAVPRRADPRAGRRLEPRGADAARSTPDRVDELVRVLPRRTTIRSTPSSACFDGIVDVLGDAEGEGRRLGVVTAKRRRRCERVFDGAGIGDVLRRRRRLRRHRAAQAASRARAARRSSCSTRGRTRPRTSATRRSTWPPRARPACYAVAVGWGGIHRVEDAGRVRRDAGGAAWRPLRRRHRADELRELLKRYSYAYHVLDDAGGPGRRVRPALRRARRARARPARATRSRRTRRRGASARRRRTSSARSTTSSPMGSLDKVTTDEALAKWADDVRKRLDTRRAGRVRRSSRRSTASRSTSLRERDLRARRDARRRRARRGRDAEPAHDRRDPALAAARRRRGAAAGARGARRGLHAAVRLPEAQRAPRRGGQEADAEPAQRRRGLACGRRTPDVTAAMPLSIWVYGTGYREGVELESHWETLRVAARARLPDESVRRAPRVDRGGRRRRAATGSGGAPSSTTRSTGS